MFQKILFLDFDGVLHPHTACDMRCAPALLAWLEANEAKVVITTNWRLSRSIEDLLWVFGIDMERWAQAIVGATPELPEGKGCRQREVEAWLAANAANSAGLRYAAVDDNGWLYEEGCPWLVLCDPQVGIGEAELVRLGELLGL